MNGDKETEASPKFTSASQPYIGSDFSSDGIFKAFEWIASCHSALTKKYTDEKITPATEIEDVETSIANDRGTLWHPTRLSLHEPVLGHNGSGYSASVVVSDLSMGYWQQFTIKSMTQGTAEGLRQLMEQDCLCPILQRELTSRIVLEFENEKSVFMNGSEAPDRILQAGSGVSLKTVLENYRLTPKDKVMLSYAIAWSYWKYYDTVFMRRRWTSDTLLFMPEEDQHGPQRGKLALSAYLPFPFISGSTGDDTDSDIRTEDLYSHRCPRIFDIGVLLLEIGLAKPLKKGFRRDPVSQENLNHCTAKVALQELEETEWEGFRGNKTQYDWAVHYCINGSSSGLTTDRAKVTGTTQSRIRPMSNSKLRKSKDASSSARDEIRERRKTFYEKVVSPLSIMAKTGFNTKPGDITYASKKEPDPIIAQLPDLQPSIPSHMGRVATETPESLPQAAFNSVVIPNMWLESLKHISRYVEQRRRDYDIFKPVRIAILDTGFDDEFPAIRQKKGLLRMIEDEKDFVTPDPTNMTDNFGHGTLMARFIMECAPGCEIIVGRVSKDTRSLGGSQEAISEAIQWAGLTKRADIISMSFGFPGDSRQISKAINTVQEQRDGKVIFMASAGNSPMDEEGFPARHPSVISVYATDNEGNFRSAPMMATKTGGILGTFGGGDTLPLSICDEFHGGKFEHVCQPGSSVATAVMAAIGATTIAYTHVLPHLIHSSATTAGQRSVSPAFDSLEKVLQHIYSNEGMEAVLRAMSRGGRVQGAGASAEASRGHHDVNPAVFWKDYTTDMLRSSAISTALAAVQRRADKSP